MTASPPTGEETGSFSIASIVGMGWSDPAAPSESGKHTSTVKPARYDEGKSMNEESQNTVMER